MSEKLQNDIDVAVKKIADEAYVMALKHISENREAMDEIVEELGGRNYGWCPISRSLSEVRDYPGGNIRKRLRYKWANPRLQNAIDGNRELNKAPRRSLKKREEG